MGRFFLIMVVLLLLGVGCSENSTPRSLDDGFVKLPIDAQIGLANPASTYCEEQGGKLEIAENDYGSTAYCGFPDGTYCEEWEFYRGECGTQQKTDNSSVIQQHMQLTSPAFQHEGLIPSKYTCDGQDINPSLTISSVPEGAKSLALIVDDPDAPGGTWVHWVVWNIDPGIGIIAENSKPGLEGVTSLGQTGWGGPCPPSGTHRYYFKLYALDTLLQDGVKETVGADALVSLMEGHILGQAELMGKYGE
ncbi:MAG TPA: hypothetical protein DCS29_01360 [Candidatus Magasanikbacteria bacterium]|nr:hypothetical protein [Candidatus Magasanikbacteria bacterium]